MKTFSELGLSPEFVKVIEKQGITKPTSIQEQSIPLIMQGYDVIGESATGSGKTLAFGAGVVAHAIDKRHLSTIILTPTREIAQQVATVIQSFSRNIQVLAVYGGVGIEPQIKKLQTAQVVVGTPGRILDHIERRTINLNNISMMVLDEADRMFDMGFIDDIKLIFKQTPEEKQTVLFSATFPREIQVIIQKFMREPRKVLGVKQVDPKKLKQIYYNVPKNLKFSMLSHILNNEESVLTMVFCNTKRMVDIVAENLKVQGIKARAIHGGFTQNKRERALDDVKALKATILICTDVAARGLDITDVTHVINYDLPNDSKDYVHRIGRTARAEKKGMVINLLARNDFDQFSRILRDYRFEIPEEKRPHLEEIQLIMPQEKRPHSGGRSPRSHGSNMNRGSRGGSSFSRGPRSSSSSSDRPRRSYGQGDNRDSGDRPHFGARRNERDSSEGSSRPRFSSNRNDREGGSRPRTNSFSRGPSRNSSDSRSSDRSFSKNRERRSSDDGKNERSGQSRNDSRSSDSSFSKPKRSFSKPLRRFNE